MGDGLTIERTIDLDATPDEVWSALTDESTRSDWLDDGEHRLGGVEESVPGERLAFRWWSGPGDGSRVEFTIEELDEGRTRLTVHETSLSSGRSGFHASVLCRELSCDARPT